MSNVTDASVPTEYQIVPADPALKAYIEPIYASTMLEAERIKALVSQHMPGWEICPVNVGATSYQAGAASSVTVSEIQRLMARHGQDMMVLVGWSAASAHVNIVTAGSTRGYSEGALELASNIATGLGMTDGKPLGTAT